MIGAVSSAGRLGRSASLGLVPWLQHIELEQIHMPRPVADPRDPPWCASGGPSWRIHGDPVFPVGGLLALWTQSLHPLALAGVVDHSDFAEHPIRRAVHTGRFVYTTTFAPGSQAAQACAVVRQVHTRVVGTAPDGRPYAAADPELLDWVHCALLNSLARVWLLYSAAPDPTLLDGYVAEQAQVPRALGDPDPPATWAALQDRLAEHRRHLAVTDDTRRIGAWLAHPPLPGALRLATPAYQAMFLLAQAAAPGWVRALWGARLPAGAIRRTGRLVLGGVSGLSGPYTAVA